MPEIHYGEVGVKPILPPLNEDHPANEDPEDTEGEPVSQELIDLLGFDPGAVDWDEEENNP